jgi:hypothetical protein
MKLDGATSHFILGKRLVIQIDESEDVSDEAEMLVYIRYLYVKKGATVVD